MYRELDNTDTFIYKKTKVKKFFMLAAGIAILHFADVAKAQNDCSTSVNEAATISQPIKLYKNTDLNFGSIVTGVAQGNVHVFGTIGALTIPASGSPTGVTTTSATYPGGTGPAKYTGTGLGNVQAQVSSFIVTGEPGVTYSITVSGGTSVKTGIGDAPHTMTVVLDNPAGGAVNAGGTMGTLQTSGNPGTDKFTIGGTLTVKASQLSGLYTGTFNVVVAYN